MLDPWIGFLNEEVALRPRPQRSLARECLRQRVLDRAASSFPFPLEVRFRATVLGQREVDGVPHLILGPSALTGQALAVLGGVLVPSDRDLYEGSVVEATCWLADPDAYDIDEGIMSVGGQLDVIVPVER